MLFYYCFGLGAFVAGPFVAFALVIYRRQKNLPIREGSRPLLVIAHPDDETMFFAPTILRLVQKRVQPFILCVTSGNADGLGSVRKRELHKAVTCLGMPAENLTILEMDHFLDGFHQTWDSAHLALLIHRHLECLDCTALISFDGGGVSGHPNHISCFLALEELLSRGLLLKDIEVFVLESVPLIRKYISIFDLFQSFFTAQYMFFSPNPIPIYCAMSAHRSQLVWFRHLYLAFSRYVLINTYRRIKKPTDFG